MNNILASARALKGGNWHEHFCKTLVEYEVFTQNRDDKTCLNFILGWRLLDNRWLLESIHYKSILGIFVICKVQTTAIPRKCLINVTIFD